jgi:hypothetical protein
MVLILVNRITKTTYRFIERLQHLGQMMVILIQIIGRRVAISLLETLGKIRRAREPGSEGDF